MVGAGSNTTTPGPAWPAHWCSVHTPTWYLHVGGRGSTVLNAALSCPCNVPQLQSQVISPRHVECEMCVPCPQEPLAPQDVLLSNTTWQDGKR